MMAVGQVAQSDSSDYGNRTVTYTAGDGKSRSLSRTTKPHKSKKLKREFCGELHQARRGGADDLAEVGSSTWPSTDAGP